MAAENKPVTTGQLIFSVVYILIFPAMVLFFSGDWFWPEGWLFGIGFTSMSLYCTHYLYHKDPALLAERFKLPGEGNQKSWDKYLLCLFGLLFLTWIIIMPLDAKRYGWTTNFPLWLKVTGGVIFLAAAFFLFRAFTDNTFLSPLVRIQTERKQHVISTGVYGFVRHPMYLGAFLFFVGTSLILSSKYGLLMGLLMSLILSIRIIGEERMLINELEGYSDYMKNVKYRLIPFIW
jgi:protein-S-isoprenylcysteine O-methyltransferase Ste14